MTFSVGRQSAISNGLAEMERFERSKDFSRHLSRVLPCQLGDISEWRKARESNPTRAKPPQFSKLLDSLYCRAFLKTWQGRSDPTFKDEVSTGSGSERVS